MPMPIATKVSKRLRFLSSFRSAEGENSLDSLISRKPDEKVLGIYDNKSGNPAIVVTDDGLHILTSPKSKRISYADIHKVNCETDPKSLLSNESLRQLKVVLNNGELVELMITGQTADGDLDILSFETFLFSAINLKRLEQGKQ